MVVFPRQVYMEHVVPLFDAIFLEEQNSDFLVE